MLTTTDLKNCLKIIQAALHCESQVHLSELWSMIEKLYPVKSMQITLCDCHSNIEISSPKVIHFGEPAWWEEQFSWYNSCDNNPILQMCLKKNRIINTGELDIEKRESAGGKDKDHRDGYLVGKKRQLINQPSSITSISFIEEELTVQEHLAIEMILPHINEIPNHLDWVEKPELTKQEWKVLYWAAQIKSNEDIGLKTGITERTVRFHLKNICNKFNVEDRVGAVQTAIRYRML